MQGDRLVRWLTHLSGTTFVKDSPKRLGVAVSGGGDSMALLDLMAKHADRLNFQIEAVTVNHGLRDEAAAEAQFVQAHCQERGLPHTTFEMARVDGRGNLQAEARAARYKLIADWATSRDLDAVALGHTKDDQAETFLMRLSRAAGVDGLATMDARFESHGITWLRPLLATAGDDLRRYLTHRNIAWCEDPSNVDLNFDRVKARQILTTLAPLGIDADRLAHVSQNISTAKAALSHYTRIEAERVVHLDQGDVILDRAPQPPIPVEIERRLLNTSFRWINGAPYPPRAASLDEMGAALLRGAAFTLAGCLVTASADRRLRITREFNAVKATRAPTNAVWDGRWSLQGPHAPDLQIRVLGGALSQIPDWRDHSLPRESLIASPAIWREDTLVAAPVAGFGQGWTAKLTKERDDFAALLL